MRVQEYAVYLKLPRKKLKKRVKNLRFYCIRSQGLRLLSGMLYFCQRNFRIRTMIKNILFDWGGVLIHLDKSRCAEAFARMGVKVSDELTNPYGQRADLMDFERGTVNEERLTVNEER